MAKLYRSAAREAAEQRAIMTRLSAKYEGRLRREIARAMNKAARAYVKSGQAGATQALQGHSENIERILTPLWTNSIEIMGERLRKKSEKSEFYESIIKNWFVEFAYEKIKRIAGTTREQLNRIIIGGVSEGLGTDGIGKLIRERVPGLSRYRAHVIARTEVHASGNYGSMRTANNIDPQLKKEWIAVNDDRTRGEDPSDEFDHMAANGQTVNMDKPFVVSGEPLMYPGDPSGSAGNIINCRCVIGYVR